MDRIKLNYILSAWSFRKHKKLKFVFVLYYINLRVKVWEQELKFTLEFEHNLINHFDTILRKYN